MSHSLDGKPVARRPRAGAAATEFAMVLPLFLLIFLGCIDFARFVNAAIAVTNAARAGAGLAILSRYPDPDPTAPAGLANWQRGVCRAVASELGMTADFTAAGNADPNGYTNSQGLYVQVTRQAETGGLWSVHVTARFPFDWWCLPGTALPEQTVIFRAIR